MKLLVTTDFSQNSKGAIKFAKTLAKQSKDVSVVFYHSLYFMKPTSWSDEFFQIFKEDEKDRISLELKNFVHKVLGKDKSRFSKIDFVVEPTMSTDKEIVAFAKKSKADFICIATQGAGLVRKIMGTHTAYIVNNSTIPVFVIPSHYKAKELNKAVYLSDFENLKKEVNKVIDISTDLKFKFEILHYMIPLPDKKKLEANKALFEKENLKKVSLNIVKNTFDLSLTQMVTNYAVKFKPELLIMFTNKEKGFFESLFLPSKTKELTYSTKVPVLVFSK